MNPLFSRLYISIKQLLLTPDPRYQKFIKRFWIAVAASIVTFILYVYCVIWNPFNLFGPMPSFAEIENPKQVISSEVISADGVSLGGFFRENRSMVTYDELSPVLVKTLLISEDHRFHDHSGLDLPAYLRVVIGVLTFSSQGGGSTLTQQTAKNLFRTRGPELQGGLAKWFGPLDLVISKTKEWIIAVRLERNFTKEEIIALYLNTVPFNNNAYGIKVAAETYFQKTPARLKLHECALLVGMLQGTDLFNPVVFPDRAKRKRNQVLDKLLAHEYIRTVHALDSLKQLPLDLNFSVPNHNKGLAPYFRSALQNELAAWCRKRNIDLLQAGLKIYTTIDSRMQALAEKAAREQMSVLQKMFDQDWNGRNPWVDNQGMELTDFLDRKIRQTDEYKEILSMYPGDSDSVAIKINEKKRMRIFTWAGRRDTLISLRDYVRHHARYLHCGLMSMDPRTGAIKAWVGGIDHTFFKYDHVRQSSRQAGSTFKAFVYGLAMENGFSPCQEYQDITPAINIDGKIYQPKNANGTYGDGNLYTLRRALAKSLNSVTMQLMQKLEPGNVASFAKRLGITTQLDPVYSLGLGTSDVTLYDMVGAYSTFVNGGVYTKPFYLVRIEDRYGNVLENFSPSHRQVISPATAYTIVHLLKGGVEEEGGSSRALSEEVKSGNEVGGKTGTTDNGSDGWFMGITRDLVTGVWVGGDERSIHFPQWGESSGAKTALPIWDNYMRQVYRHPEIGYTKGSFVQPAALQITLDCNKFDETDSPEVLE
jgi:penicillin-binding protein 1A